MLSCATYRFVKNAKVEQITSRCCAEIRKRRKETWYFITQAGKSCLTYAMTYKPVGAIVARVQPSLYTLLGVKGDVTEGLGLILDKKALWWLNKEQKRWRYISLKSGFMGLGGISILHVWSCFACNSALSSWWYCVYNFPAPASHFSMLLAQCLAATNSK